MLIYLNLRCISRRFKTLQIGKRYDKKKQIKLTKWKKIFTRDVLMNINQIISADNEFDILAFLISIDPNVYTP